MKLQKLYEQKGQTAFYEAIEGSFNDFLDKCDYDVEYDDDMVARMFSPVGTNQVDIYLRDSTQIHYEVEAYTVMSYIVSQDFAQILDNFKKQIRRVYNSFIISDVMAPGTTYFASIYDYLDQTAAFPNVYNSLECDNFILHSGSADMNACMFPKKVFGKFLINFTVQDRNIEQIKKIDFSGCSVICLGSTIINSKFSDAFGLDSGTSLLMGYTPDNLTSGLQRLKAGSALDRARFVDNISMFKRAGVDLSFALVTRGIKMTDEANGLATVERKYPAFYEWLIASRDPSFDKHELQELLNDFVDGTK